MKFTLTVVSLLSTFVLAGCAAGPEQKSSSAEEICDIKEPPLGSRIVEKIRCAPKKKESQSAG